MKFKNLEPIKNRLLEHLRSKYKALYFLESIDELNINDYERGKRNGEISLLEYILDKYFDAKEERLKIENQMKEVCK